MDLANSLEALIKSTVDDFKKITDTEWADKPNPLKWSKKEILGHLIDSAMNNLRRFNEAQFLPGRPYVLERYRQEDLVSANRYQELPVDHLISLWTFVNMQITYVLLTLSYETLLIEIVTSEGQPQTMGWLAEDYVVHLRHHLDQIFMVNKISR